MKRLSRRTMLISSISAATVIVLAVGAIVVLAITGNASARAEYDDATASVTTSTSALNAAQHDLAEAQQAAVLTAQNGLALAASADATLLADAATIEQLSGTVTTLTDVAGLESVEGTLVAAEALPDVSSAPAATPPSDREALISAAADLRADAAELDAKMTVLAAETLEVTTASADVDTAAFALVTSAHDFGSAAATPALASAESLTAFTAALGALAAPAPDADLSALMISYRDTWYGTVASDAVARVAAGAPIATYLRGVLIVNKTYAIPSTFGNGLTAETSKAFASMKADAAALGLNIYIASGYRSFSSQTSIYNRYKASEGEAGADAHSARPGHSEHQTGLAFDLNSIRQSFGSTPEGIWVRDNAHRYGFIVRYPEGKQAITGYIWEPWHLRYVGVDVATTLHDSGQTLEEYLGVTSVYN